LDNNKHLLKKGRIQLKRNEVKALMENSILGSSDVQEMLLINRSRLKALVDAGKITPIKELKRESLFWLPDVEALKKEMLKDSRSNLYKQGVVQNA
jgi:hypothetical protein